MSEHTDKVLKEMGKSSGFREHVDKALFGSDFISRQAAIEAASHGCMELRGTFGRVEDELNAIPSADVRENVRGEWIYKVFDDETGIGNSFFCSVCGKPQGQIYDSYCAACGADMRGEK